MSSAIRKAWSVHRWLTAATLVSIALVVPPLLGMWLDPKVITGVNAWIKPLKFAMAAAIYGASFLWLLGFVHDRPRLVRLLGTVTGAALVLEVVLITMQVVRGTTSHFNAATPFDAAVFSVMGGAITILALMNLTLGIVLLLQRMPDRVFAAGLRYAVFASFLGMMVAFLMTSPTPAQLEAMKAGAGVAAIGAHSVGVPDGGPGLPFFGWSLEGGDLRVPHFIGIHGMQALALLGWFLILPAAKRRWSEAQRRTLVRIGGATYIGWLGLLTWQALRGQSVATPDEATAVAYAVLLGGALFAVWLTLRARSNRGGSTQGGLELDELLLQRGPVIAQQTQRLVLHALPISVGAVVRSDAGRRETSVPLASIAGFAEVDQSIAHERPDVTADGRGIGPDGVREVAEGDAARDAKHGEDGPLRAPDARHSERVVVSGGDRATRPTHARPDAPHRFPDVDLEQLRHPLHIQVNFRRTP
jgi:hypothetical protein